MKPNHFLFFSKDGEHSEHKVLNPWLIAYDAPLEADYIECHNKWNKCDSALVIR
jgi:hypothetical protein